MSENAILGFVEKQDWLKPLEDKGDQLMKSAYEAAGPGGQVVKNALHGVYLGHPLHPAITDVPVGSWTVALALDLLEVRGDRQYAPGADAAVALGLLGSVPAALSGMTDWMDTHGRPKRVGVMHGLLNMGAVALYTASYAARKSHKRGLGRWLGFAGYSLVIASAYLGGELSYTQKIGVNHAAEMEELPQDFTVACSESDLPQEKPTKATVNGAEIFLFRRGSTVHALGNKCSHLAGPLSDGRVEGDVVECPWHCSRFRLSDGSVIDGPATNPQPVLEVKIQGGNILVKAPPGEPQL